MVRERNLKMLSAAKEDPGKARPAKIKEWKELIGAATRYLLKLEEELLPLFITVTRWRAEARRCTSRARAIQRGLSQSLGPCQATNKPSLVQPLPPNEEKVATGQPSQVLPSDTIVAAAIDTKRRQREADERFNEMWVRCQTQTENNASAQPADLSQTLAASKAKAEPKMSAQMLPTGPGWGI